VLERPRVVQGQLVGAAGVLRLMRRCDSGCMTCTSQEMAQITSCWCHSWCAVSDVHVRKRMLLFGCHVSDDGCLQEVVVYSCSATFGTHGFRVDVYTRKRVQVVVCEILFVVAEDMLFCRNLQATICIQLILLSNHACGGLLGMCISSR
jgi:hypothetical protein